MGGRGLGRRRGTTCRSHSGLNPVGPEGSSTSVTSSPRRSSLPSVRLIRHVFLPIQPSPARSANSRSGQRMLVHSNAPAHGRNLAPQEPPQANQAPLDHLVVVGASRVAGDHDAVVAKRDLRRLRSVVVAHGDADDALGSWKEAAGVAANLERTGHVVHVGMVAVADPLPKPCCPFDRSCGGDPDEVESEHVDRVLLEISSQRVPGHSSSVVAG